MKKRNLLALCLVCFSFVGCQNFHTGKVVIEDNKITVEKVTNVEYIVVDESDKESLIKNIKEGKGAVIDRSKKSANLDDNNSAKITTDSNENNSNNSENNNR